MNRRRILAGLAAALFTITPAVVAAPAATGTATADAASYGQVWNVSSVAFTVGSNIGDRRVPPGYNSRYLGIPDVNRVKPVFWSDGRRSCIMYRTHGQTTYARQAYSGTPLLLGASSNWDIYIYMTQSSRCSL